MMLDIAHINFLLNRNCHQFFTSKQSASQKDIMHDCQRVDLLQVLQPICLNFRCLHYWLANYLHHPSMPRLPTYYNCNACPVCTKSWHEFFLPVDFQQLKVFLCTVVMIKDSMLYQDVVSALWSNKEWLKHIYHHSLSKVCKYNI